MKSLIALIIAAVLTGCAPKQPDHPPMCLQGDDQNSTACIENREWHKNNRGSMAPNGADLDKVTNLLNYLLRGGIL